MSNPDYLASLHELCQYISECLATGIQKIQQGKDSGNRLIINITPDDTLATVLGKGLTIKIVPTTAEDVQNLKDAMKSPQWIGESPCPACGSSFLHHRSEFPARTLFPRSNS